MDSELLTIPSKPIWRLRPLRNSRKTISSNTGYQHGSAPTLRSIVLDVISRSFHLYAPDDLSSLPSQISRVIITRIANDRGYDAGSEVNARKPDHATVWVYAALAEPQGLIDNHNCTYTLPGRSHTIAIPTRFTLQHLPTDPNRGEHGEHPLNALPKLYGALYPQPRYALLTTLTLDGADVGLDDRSVQALKGCSHLTVLWMRNCTYVTDMGIRQLGASLILPSLEEQVNGVQPRGMCRLRAWYLTGCRGVSDQSMKLFAKWPGLSLLDVRDTSITECGITIFNQANHKLYQGLQPPFKECTPGLRGLFTKEEEPEEVLEKLCRTLLAPDLPQSHAENRHGENTHGEPYISLHLVPSDSLPQANWLHDTIPDTATRKSRHDVGSSRSAYRTGLGQLYGNGVRHVVDDESVSQSEGVKLVGSKGHKSHPFELESEQKWRHIERSRRDPSKHVISRVFYPDADERSRAFVGGSGSQPKIKVKEIVRGKKKLMLVRMVNPEWLRLSHHRVSQITPGAVASTERSRKGGVRVTVDVTDVLGLVQSQPPSHPSPLTSCTPTRDSTAAPGSCISATRPTTASLPTKLSSPPATCSTPPLQGLGQEFDVSFKSERAVKQTPLRQSWNRQTTTYNPFAARVSKVSTSGVRLLAKDCEHAKLEANPAISPAPHRAFMSSAGSNGLKASQRGSTQSGNSTTSGSHPSRPSSKRTNPYARVGTQSQGDLTGWLKPSAQDIKRASSSTTPNPIPNLVRGVGDDDTFRSFTVSKVPRKREGDHDRFGG